MGELRGGAQILKDELATVYGLKVSSFLLFVVRTVAHSGRACVHTGNFRFFLLRCKRGLQSSARMLITGMCLVPDIFPYCKLSKLFPGLSPVCALC